MSGDLGDRSTQGFTIETRVCFKKQHREGNSRMQGDSFVDTREKIPHISRLMALAIYFDELIRSGKVKNYSELARLGQVSRARITQIMNLLVFG